MFVTAALLGFSGEETPAPSSLRREALIIFSRHGIRVPYAPPGGIAEYSKAPAASWMHSKAADLSMLQRKGCPRKFSKKCASFTSSWVRLPVECACRMLLEFLR